MSCVTVGQDWPNFAVERCSTSSQFDFPPTQRRSSAVAIIEPTGRKKTAIMQGFTMRAVLICLLVTSVLTISLDQPNVLRRKERDATRNERTLGYSNPRYGSSYYYKHYDEKGTKGSKSAKGHYSYSYYGGYKKSKASKSSKKGK